MPRIPKGDKMILADYRCGCTWVGQADECIEYCAKHGEDRRRTHDIGPAALVEKGWCWQLPADKDGAGALANAAGK